MRSRRRWRGRGLRHDPQDLRRRDGLHLPKAGAWTALLLTAITTLRGLPALADQQRPRRPDDSTTPARGTPPHRATSGEPSHPPGRITHDRDQDQPCESGQAARCKRSRLAAIGPVLPHRTPLRDGYSRPQPWTTRTQVEDGPRHVCVPMQVGRHAVGVRQAEHLSDLMGVDEIVELDLRRHALSVGHRYCV